VKISDALSLPEGPQRTATIVAWVQSLYSSENQVPVLVGGAAVEILTGGAYTTGDFDFVGHVPASVRRTLETSGFKRSGRHWIHDEAQIFLEFPGEALGPTEKSIRYGAFGYDVLLVSIEDLLVDRLGAWDYWKSGVDGANAYLLYRTCRERIDDERLTRRALEEGFEVALEALRSFDAEWGASEPDPAALEVWANQGPRNEAP
jgi:hypothetical protein